MRVDEFDFDLPEDRIALRPAEERDGARLLHVTKDHLADRTVKELPLLLREGDMLVLNDTRVIPAQLRGLRSAREEGGGGDVEVDVTLHKELLQTSRDNIRWRAFIRPAKRVREGDQLIFGSKLIGEVETRDGAECTLHFSRERAEFEAALAEYGAPPLPPYIARKRDLDEADAERYQTIFADKRGSVAAPTAGLHFTDELFAALDEKGVKRQTITLHVGAGTFLPVTVDDTDDHKMHAEWGKITSDQAAAINDVRKSGGRIVAVGTTSLRLLESAVGEDGAIKPYQQETDIFIMPGYRFKAVDALLTNFHLPKSTLFMLVCAFAGTDQMKCAYAHAIAERYRFYSYGDACYLERNDQH